MTTSDRFMVVIALALAACRPALRPSCFDSASQVEARASAGEQSPLPERATRTPASLRVAVTVDDLPGSFDGLPSYAKSRVVEEVVAALKAHGIAPVGFVNGIYADADADAQAGLQSWLDAGFEVGNHSYSHQSARALPVAAFLADVEKNRAFLRRVAPERSVPYFRFPYLERGNSPAERVAITEALARDGYRVANVSVDFTDWAYAPAHARCFMRGDQSALRALSESYVQSATAALFWAEESATRLFGRSTPHVLLLHAHAATAENLPALLVAYEQAGVTWITLEEALRDPAFAEPPARDHGDTALIAEAVRTSGAALRSFVPRPLVLLDLACR
jgi:peptidoglycan/xylan/chitin deacetylase (PgdA/CDA1 family)